VLLPLGALCIHVLLIEIDIPLTGDICVAQELAFKGRRAASVGLDGATKAALAPVADGAADADYVHMLQHEG